MKRPNILVIEDYPSDAELFRHALQEMDYRVEIAQTATAGRDRARSGDFQVVLTDLNLGGPSKKEGTELIAELHKADPHLPVILMTGGHTADIAIDAIKLGAFDYFSKPDDFTDENFRAELGRMLHTAVASRELMRKMNLREGDPGAQEDSGGDRIVGRSRLMQDVYKEIGRIADKPVTVLIRGETGTGKELVARAIWTYSSRANKDFIVVNCAAIPESLLESELFGHEQGAFTGAKGRRLGRFELAHQGTIFLDEIGDMNVKLQQKLLRVLQEGTIERVGGKEPIPVDVRVLAATHRDLEAAIEEGEFRQDLYFRLNVALISLPPLRDRREDIPELFKYFVERYGAELGGLQNPRMRSALKVAVDSFSSTGAPDLSELPEQEAEAIRKLAEKKAEAIRFLQQESWPGNVRELASVVRKALLIARHYPVTLDIVRRALDQTRPARPAPEEPFAAHVAKVLAAAQKGERENVLAELMEVVDRELYSQTIRRSGGEQSRAARWLGVSRPTIREKLTRYALHPVRETKTN
jgi:DNA-binding NtrC family response regulator